MNITSGLLALVGAVVSLGAAPILTSAQTGGLTLKGGLSYGNVSNEGLFPGNVNSRTGFALGIGAATGGPIGFGLEALYAQRGMTSSAPLASRRLDYVDVPLYVRAALPMGPVQPFFYLGPQISFEVKCGSDGRSCPDTGRDKVTYAGVIGAGARLGTGTGMSLEARYIYGLTDLRYSTVTTSASYRTRSLLLLLGFGF
jgi:hypothetical protein